MELALILIKSISNYILIWHLPHLDFDNKQEEITNQLETNYY